MGTRWDAQPAAEAARLTVDPPITDQPVMGDHWRATRHLDSGSWMLARLNQPHCSPPVFAAIRFAVVDDFGNLRMLGGDALVASHRWSESAQPDAGTAAQLQAERDAARAMAALSQPAPSEHAPVQVEVIVEGPGMVAASLVVGPDERRHVTLYALHVDGEAPMLLTHAQLAALTLGAHQLLAAAHAGDAPLH